MFLSWVVLADLCIKCIKILKEIDTSRTVSISITETVRFANNILAICMVAVFIYTLQILITVALVPGRITPSNLPGSFLSIIFLSDPIRLVKSYRPLPFPSPFSFFQTLKEMPQLFTAFMRACRCLSLVWLGGLLRFSFLSHSSASLTRLSVSLSVEFEENTDFNMQYYLWC